MALKFFEAVPQRRIFHILTDPHYLFPLPDHISTLKIARNEFLDNAITTGFQLGEQLFRQAPESAIWITDDLVSIGFCQAFFKHGIDLIAENRILSYGSPSGQVTQEMRMPVIGFCPMEIGRLAAEAFSAFLVSKANHTPSCAELVIPPASNPAASEILQTAAAPGSIQ